MTTLEQAILDRELWRAWGDRVVFTNGCFDILHAGHVRYLAECKSMGDRLIVGINSDASVRRLKGEMRPYCPQEERAALLEALEVVDDVVVFEEDTPCEIIRALKPDIHVKGSDYRASEMPETPIVHGYGGLVVIVERADTRSTSRLAQMLAAG